MERDSSGFQRVVELVEGDDRAQAGGKPAGNRQRHRDRGKVGEAAQGEGGGLVRHHFGAEQPTRRTASDQVGGGSASGSAHEGMVLSTIMVPPRIGLFAALGRWLDVRRTIRAN